jgi:holin-like protein
MNKIPALLLPLLMLALIAWSGNQLSRWLHTPVPGVVLGMAGLAAFIAFLRWRRPMSELRVSRFFAPASRPLLRHLGLLFVPAGAGVMTQWDLIRAEWLPVVAGLLGSTLAGLLATALVTQWLWPRDEARH